MLKRKEIEFLKDNIPELIQKRDLYMIELLNNSIEHQKEQIEMLEKKNDYKELLKRYGYVK